MFVWNWFISCCFRSRQPPQPDNDDQDESSCRPARQRRVGVRRVLNVRGGQEELQTDCRRIQRHRRWEEERTDRFCGKCSLKISQHVKLVPVVSPEGNLPLFMLSHLCSWLQVILSVIITTGSSPPKTGIQHRSSPAVPCRTEEAGGTRTATRQTSTASTALMSNTR